MDTIIYLYHSRNGKEFLTEKWQEKDYCLIRLGIPSLVWQQVGQPELKKEPDLQKLPKKRKYRLKRCRNKAVAKGRIEDSKQASFFDEIEELQTAICLLGENSHWTYCVYEDFLEKKLNVESWKRHWKVPKFEDYTEYFWVEQLMKYARYDRYIILGYASCVANVLCNHARRMRGVKWIMKAKQYTPQVQAFIEEFYEEYGLVIEIDLMEETETWIGMHPASVVPVNVLDFTGEEKLSACDVAKESVWLDMCSVEGKNRRMEARNPSVNYFSLKKEWKQRQKASINLDTLLKNRYNT